MTHKLHYYILCLLVMFGEGLEDEEKRCTIAYGKTDQCPYDIMCPGDGQGVMVDYVVISNTADCKPAYVRDSNKSNDLDRAILNTIRRECNGRKTCNLNESLRNRFTVKCDGKTYFADVMDLRYHCKTFAFNHSSVYNVNDELISVKVQDSFYLVLAADNMNTQRSCSVRSTKTSFSFRLLNVELEESKSCRRQEAPAICPDTMTIEGDGQKLVTYTHKYPPGVLETRVIDNNFNLDVNTSLGLLWIEFIAKEPVYLSCQDASKDGRTTGKIATIPTTVTPAVTTATNTPEVTTPTTSTVKNTSYSQNATAAFDFIKESSNQQAIPTGYIYIVVLATVAVLSLATNIVLFHKYCKNRKLKKENVYSYPTLQNQGSYAYSAVSDDANPPPSPVPRNLPALYIDPVDQVYDDEYIDIQDSGGDYSFDGALGKYKIQQNNGHSITDNVKC